MQMLLAALSLFVSSAWSSGPLEPQARPDGAVAALSLFEAKEQNDKVLDGAYDTLVAAIAKRTAEIDALLEAERDTAGKRAKDLEYERKLLEGERLGLESNGRFPTQVQGSVDLAASVTAAKAKVIEAYKAAGVAALKVGDTKRHARLAAGREFYASLHPLGPRFSDEKAAGLVRVGTNTSDWKARPGSFEPPKVVGPDMSWTPFVFQRGLPREFIAKLTLRRSANEGELVVVLEDGLGFKQTVTVSKSVIDAFAPKDAGGSDRDCHVRFVVAKGQATLEIEGEEVEVLTTKEAGLGLDLSQLASVSLARSDARGPLRVKSLSIKALPRAAGSTDESAANGGSSPAESAEEPGAEGACRGSLSVTREWSEQLLLIREARKKWEATVDRLAQEILRAFEDLQQPYRDGLLDPSSEDALLKANQRIEKERQFFLFAAEIPSLLAQETPLKSNAFNNDHYQARKELYRAFEKTEKLLQPRARPAELRMLRDDLAQLESYQDLAPWLEPEDVTAMIKFKSRELWEWAWVGDKWLGWRRNSPDGQLVSFLLQGELPLELIAECVMHAPKIADADELEIGISRSGDERVGKVLGSQVREIVARNDAGDLVPFTLRVIVQAGQTTITVDQVRVFCETAAGPAPSGQPTIATDLTIARAGAPAETWIKAIRLKPIKSSNKRASKPATPRSTPPDEPRVLPPPRDPTPPPDVTPPWKAQPDTEAPLAAAAPPSAERNMTWAEILEPAPDPLVIPSESVRANMALEKLPWRVRDRVSGIEMLLVPPGSYKRGAAKGDGEAQPNERPPHRVTISRPFYLSRYEVQQSEWAHVLTDASSKSDERGLPWTGTYAAATGFLERCSGLRLPTEAEWEFACRAGGSDARYAPLAACAWSPSISGNTAHAVGELQANELGFCDMLGNVWEWCSDFYDPDAYTRSAQGVVDPAGPGTGTQRVMRGGSFSSSESDAQCRSSMRGASEPAGTRGFRVARTP